MRGPFTVELVETESSNVYTVLGISEERSDEIAEICKIAYKEERYFTDTLKAIVEQLPNINEVIFAILCAGKMHSLNRTEGPASMKNPAEMMKVLELMMQLRGNK